MFEIYSIADRPELLKAVMEIFDTVWEPKLPPTRSAPLVSRVSNDFPQYILAALDQKTNRVAGYAASVPFHGPEDLKALPDEGYDAVLEKAVDDFDAGRQPNMLAALAIAILPDFQRKGLSSILADALCELSRTHGFTNFVLPVRPIKKAAEPFTPMQEYMNKKREDGEPFDPWIRLHKRHGATLVKVCSASMNMKCPISQWEKTTGMSFPKSGEYAIPGGLAPLKIDIENNQGILTEPNVWMHYKIK